MSKLVYTQVGLAEVGHLNGTIELLNNTNLAMEKMAKTSLPWWQVASHLDPGCAIFVRDFFRWSVFGITTKLMGSPKTHGVTGHVGIQEF